MVRLGRGCPVTGTAAARAGRMTSLPSISSEEGHMRDFRPRLADF
jgi:hypothetical protein